MRFSMLSAYGNEKVEGMQLFKNDLNNNTRLNSDIELPIWFILLLTLL
jgi:hypothetical protein